MTEPAPVNVTTMPAPASPLTSTTPPGCVASASEAPLDTPAPKASTGVLGPVVSRTASAEPKAPMAIPAASACAR